MAISESLSKAISLSNDLDELQFRLHSGVHLIHQCHTAMERGVFEVGQDDYDALFAAYLFLSDMVDDELPKTLEKLFNCLFDIKRGAEQARNAT